MGAEITLVLVAVGLGALIQGSIGFGFSLVAVPTMTLLQPEAVPATLLLVAIPMTLFMSITERHSIDVVAFAWITGGRLLGTFAGVGLLALVPDNSLARLLGLLIVVAALMSFMGPTFEVRNGTQGVAGIASGVMSTAAALGGPPLALVNQRRLGPELRSTLAVSFLAGLVMSLVALALSGRIDKEHVVWAFQLLPGLILGLWTGRQFAEFLDRRWLRPMVLAFAAASGVVVVLLGPQM